MSTYAQNPEWDLPKFVREALENCRMHMSGYGQGRRGRRGTFGSGWVMGGPGGPGFWGAGHRAGRGDVRLAILLLLDEEPMHGYQMMQELAERSGGIWRPSPGSGGR